MTTTDSQDFENQANTEGHLALAAMGEGSVAYVRPMTSEEVKKLFPQAPALQPGLELYALLSASGAPILLTASREAAVMNAKANDLDAVSVH